MQVNLNFDKRQLYVIIASIIVLTSILIVAAFNSGGPPSFVGHSSEEGAVPPGAVLYFNLTSCPNGYTEMTNISGMYVVAGNSTSSSLGAQIGSRLSNVENRATGAHAVTILDPTHVHSIATVNVDAATAIYSPGTACVAGSSNPCTSNTGSSGTINSAATGVTASAGSVAGTNAPYVQLLTCVKT